MFSLLLSNRRLRQRSPGEFPGISTIEQLCAHLVNLIISEENPTEALQNIDEILGRLQKRPYQFNHSFSH